MYRHLLIATDGSELAEKALEHGLGLARALGAGVTILTVSEGWATATEDWSVMDLAQVQRESGRQSPEEAYEQAASEKAEQILNPAAAAAQKLGLKATALHEKDALPAPGIIRNAEALGCDLIVMGSHGRSGIDWLLVGSQATEVMRKASMPVLVVR